MNILHMKYAVEVARHGSISKAAEELFVAQANLSRSIKTLEADLGISIFDRSFKGMVLTPEGEEFVSYAKQILGEIDHIEQKYKAGVPVRNRFSISVPRASYISEAFTRFSKKLGTEAAEVFYLETNAAAAINNILSEDYKLGIIRYAAGYDDYYKELLSEKGLTYEVISEFRHVLLMSRENPLAQADEIHFSDLEKQIQVSIGDPFVPSLPMSTDVKVGQQSKTNRHIYIFERGSQMSLLSDNPETFMWVSPLPQTLLSRYNLIQRTSPDQELLYKDVLIRRKEYHLTRLDRMFISELAMTRRECMNPLNQY